MRNFLFKKASSLSREDRVSKLNVVCSNMALSGKKVTSVPRFSVLPVIFSGPKGLPFA